MTARTHSSSTLFYLIPLTMRNTIGAVLVRRAWAADVFPDRPDGRFFSCIFKSCVFGQLYHFFVGCSTRLHWQWLRRIGRALRVAGEFRVCSPVWACSMQDAPRGGSAAGRG